MKNITIYADTSSLEIFLNDGSMVFTSRVYSEKNENDIRFQSCAMKANIQFYRLGSICVR